MRVRLSVLAAGVGFLALGLPALAHHSGAAVFDNTKKIDLTGVVTKMEWVNPHAHFYLDVKDSTGKVTNWNLELASPGQFQFRHRADHRVPGRTQAELPIGLRGQQVRLRWILGIAVAGAAL